MVALGNALLLVSVFASQLASAQPHEKRLFGFNWGDSNTVTTTSTTSSSPISSTTSSTSTSSSTSSTVKTTSTTTTSSSTTSSSTTSTSSVLSTTSTSSVKTSTTVALATGTNTPYGNTLIFSNLVSIVGTSDKLSTYTLTSYSPQACSTLCKADSRCSFYNIYSASTILSFIFGSTNYCALYDNQHSWLDASDSGLSSGLMYTQSNGYVMYGDDTAAQVTVATGTTVVASSTSASLAASSGIKSTSAVASAVSSAKVSSTTASSSTTAGALNGLAAALPTSVSTPSVSMPVSTSLSVAVPSTSLTVASAASTGQIAALVSSAAAGAKSVISSAAAAVTVSSVPTSLATLPTTLKTSLTVSTAVSATVSTAAVCSLPGWAYSGWCSTLPSMVPQIKANVLNVASANKGFIIPLYIYPSWWTTPGAWNWIYTAAANYPSVTFTVIVNPASGPGTSVLPNTDYQHELAKLIAISNVNVLGYVDTAFGSRAAASVASDISVYAGWASGSLGLDGIFFDNQAAGQSYLSMYQGYAAQVRSNSGFTNPIVGFAPGQICHPSFVDVADFVVIFESTSAAVSTDLFGWYSSFLAGLTTSQLTKLVFMLTAADASTSVVLTNLQAALNPQYLYATDNAGQWGSAFQSAPSSSFLTKALNLIASPLSAASSLTAGS